MSRPTSVDSERILWKAVVSWRIVFFLFAAHKTAAASVLNNSDQLINWGQLLWNSDGMMGGSIDI